MDKTNRAMALIAVRKQSKECADELLAQYKTGTVEDVKFLDEVLSMSMSLPEPTVPPPVTTAPSVITTDLPSLVQPLVEQVTQEVPEQIALGSDPHVATRHSRRSLQKSTTYNVPLRESEKVALRRSSHNPLLALAPGIASGEAAEDVDMLEVFNYYGIDFTLKAWIERGLSLDRNRIQRDLMREEITPSMVGAKDMAIAVRCASLVVLRLWYYCEARFASENPGKVCSRRAMAEILNDTCDKQIDVDGSTVRRNGYVRPERALTWAGGIIDKKRRDVREIQSELEKRSSRFELIPPT